VVAFEYNRQSKKDGEKARKEGCASRRSRATRSSWRCGYPKPNPTIQPPLTPCQGTRAGLLQPRRAGPGLLCGLAERGACSARRRGALAALAGSPQA